MLAPNYYHHFYDDYKKRLATGEIKTEGFLLNPDSPNQKFNPDEHPPKPGYGINKNGKMAIRGYPEHEYWRRPGAGPVEGGFQHCCTTFIFPKSKRESLIEYGHQQLKVFCDFVEPRHVGDDMQQLLRYVAREGKLFEISSSTKSGLGGLQNIPLMRLCYVPVKIQELTAIEIVIKDEHDHLIPFSEGKAVLNLTFRPIIDQD